MYFTVFVTEICEYGILVAKICKYNIFVTKVCKYALIDNFLHILVRKLRLLQLRAFLIEKMAKLQLCGYFVANMEKITLWWAGSVHKIQLLAG